MRFLCIIWLQESRQTPRGLSYWRHHQINHRECSGLFLSPSYFRYGQTVPPSKTVAGTEKVHKWYCINQRWTNTGCQVARSPGKINSCTVAANTRICGSSVWNALYVVILATGILRRLLNFPKICRPLVQTLYNSFWDSVTRLWKPIFDKYQTYEKHSLL